MKKMKKIVSFESPYAVHEDHRSKLRHQSLLQDYEELQKEMKVMRRKLQILKQKRLMLSTEVRFCKKRCRYLMKIPSKLQPQHDVLLLRNSKIKASIVSMNRKYCKKESSSQSRRGASRSHAKEIISNGVAGSSKKSAHSFDLNQNDRSFIGRDGFFLNSAGQLLDLDQNDGIHSKRDVTKKSSNLFDLTRFR